MIASPLVVRCDDCSATYEAIIRTDVTEMKDERMYLQCPQCQKVVPIATVSARGVRLRSEIAKLREVLGYAFGPDRKLMKLLRQFSREVIKAH